MMLYATSGMLVFCVVLQKIPISRSILPPQSPQWPPTYNMTESLITMQCNSSGWSSPLRASEFGIVSYDWSNAKSVWAAAKPMNAEELLELQAEQAKHYGVKHVFVYRNIVKALPWFKSVREKLNDPEYEGFFVKFDSNRNDYHVPACARENPNLCSRFYHDQEQTPEVPTKDNPHPDGSCVDYCDCGAHPCGEYLFDHRNGTMLRDFLVQKVVLGAVSGPADGLFLDDYWCSDILCNASGQELAGCPCDDPVQGPTEFDQNWQADTGLTDEDIRDMTKEWNKTMTLIQQALLDNHAYTWSLIHGQENANAMPLLLNRTKCGTMLRQACDADSMWRKSPVLFGLSVVNGTILSQLEQDLAFFLLARGDWAWLGWGVWGMTWPFNAEPQHGALPPLPHGVPVPPELRLDYGIPIEPCHEVSPNTFRRQWSRASVELDCDSFVATISFRDSSQTT